MIVPDDPVDWLSPIIAPLYNETLAPFIVSVPTFDAFWATVNPLGADGPPCGPALVCVSVPVITQFAGAAEIPSHK